LEERICGESRVAGVGYGWAEQEMIILSGKAFQERFIEWHFFGVTLEVSHAVECEEAAGEGVKGFIVLWSKAGRGGGIREGGGLFDFGGMEELGKSTREILFKGRGLAQVMEEFDQSRWIFEDIELFAVCRFDAVGENEIGGRGRAQENCLGFVFWGSDLSQIIPKGSEITFKDQETICRIGDQQWWGSSWSGRFFGPWLEQERSV
jgi:hypothetical protein